ncbi:MAG: hypothetical protein QOF73_753 [Thermomicrobiales bacterium]|jgi:hypothetical protein|nr:hypothetical protein [Thermomicrobiales bacterium]
MAEPRNSFAGRTDAELEQDLRDLGAQLAFPQTPDLAATVRSAMTGSPSRRQAEVRRFPVRRVLAAAAVVLLALAAGLVLSGGFRSAVADFLGVRGVRIVIEREEPTATPTKAPLGTQVTTPGGAPGASPIASPQAEALPVGTGLLLGQRVTLAEAQAAVPYQIQVPALGSLGEPDEVYLRTLPDGNQLVSFIYLPRPGLPETEETGVGALLMQFEARDNVEYLGKGISEGNAMFGIQVNGHRGVWIAGSHNLTLLPDPSRGCCEETRSAGNVLLWEQDGLIFRLESALSQKEAIAIAESVAIPQATPAAGSGGNRSPSILV